MSGQRYTPEFKDEAVRQVVERGYSVGEVAQRIGVSKHSLYKWVNTVKPNSDEEQAEELARQRWPSAEGTRTCGCRWPGHGRTRFQGHSIRHYRFANRLRTYAGWVLHRVAHTPSGS